MRDAARKAARQLALCGFAVDGFRPAGLDKARDTWWFFFGELSAPFTREGISGREEDNSLDWDGTARDDRP
jgi:hypothetical protein